MLLKKEDQRLLGNKRPITLLNSVYKIGAKALQRRLSPILQKIISPQQSAFLPGRNIQHNLLMVSEMLHQAEILGEEHILLKLDVCKAFDRLEWPFILASVEKAGLAQTLSAFLRAGFSSASSVILLNGRPTEPFRLTRSVRQGCTLSPLIFILAFDILSLMFTSAVDRGALVGVEFPESGVKNVQSFYADDVALLIRAIMSCILECQRILTMFGAVSGLLIIWEKTIAAFIPGGPPPAQFWLLPWQWEENSNATKYLGYPLASSFSQNLMCTQLQDKIAAKLEKVKKRHLTLAGRVLVANSLILSSLWYFVAIWAGNFGFFNQMQRMIESFFWAGRNRVARNTITQPVGKEGLGLLLIAEQYRAMVGNLLIWILGSEFHPLRCILGSHIRDLSVRKWGIANYTWVVAAGGRGASLGSVAWKNFCKAWAFLKSFMRCREPRNILEWRLLPLWIPHLNHRDPKLVKCTTKAQHMIQAKGLNHMGDILTQGGFLRPGRSCTLREGTAWENGLISPFWRTCMSALC